MAQISHHSKNLLKIAISIAVFVVMEFSLPLTTHAQARTNSTRLNARRDGMAARVITTGRFREARVEQSQESRYAVKHTKTMVVTAYSSTPDQCGGDPFITASGTRVHSGTFAVNGVKFGTKIRIPSHFGNKIFTVEDRMSSRYSSYRGDIWMQSRQEAKQWGARRVVVEIVEEIS